MNTPSIAFQWTIVVLLVLRFLISIYRCIHGKPAAKPDGFGGIIGTIIAIVILLFIYYKAGAFSLIIQ